MLPPPRQQPSRAMQQCYQTCIYAVRLVDLSYHIAKAALEMVKPTAEAPPRVFIACDRCKSRKRRCDGDTPRCSNCATHNAECTDKKPETETQESEIDAPTCTTTEDQTLICTNPGFVANTAAAGPSSIDNTISLMDFSSMHATTSSNTSNSSRLPPLIFPHFLLAKTFPLEVQLFKSQAESAASGGGFSPLPPLHIARSLVENSFSDIIPEPRFISLESFMRHLEAQYAHCLCGPAGNPARWAVVNGVFALALRFKTAAGSEAYISPITMAFYRNAALVVDPTVLHELTLLSAQALLVLAVFARGVPDLEAYTMLVTNAASKLELLPRPWFWNYPRWHAPEKEEFEKAYLFANQLNCRGALP
ncbi:hypothetical protein F4777DRAFT_582789 [Nemania sp. FL0916]|nr:hypothetical protein F4777DRAFT_582789 [Nemania sp. FL0916]